MQALDGKCRCDRRRLQSRDDTGAWGVGLGYYHTMSKQTQVYVVGSWLDNDDQANYGTAGIGNVGQLPERRRDQWGLGVGIKHSF